MPLFFFDIHNGTLHRDDEGVEFVDLATAKRAAVRASGEMLRDKIEIDAATPWKMVIRDEGDLVLATWTFSAS